jgi:hypothetical protein
VQQNVGRTEPDDVDGFHSDLRKAGARRRRLSNASTVLSRISVADMVGIENPLPTAISPKRLPWLDPKD